MLGQGHEQTHWIIQAQAASETESSRQREAPLGWRSSSWSRQSCACLHPWTVSLVFCLHLPVHCVHAGAWSPRRAASYAWIWRYRWLRATSWAQETTRVLWKAGSALATGPPLQLWRWALYLDLHNWLYEYVFTLGKILFAVRTKHDSPFQFYPLACYRQWLKARKQVSILFLTKPT